MIMIPDSMGLCSMITGRRPLMELRLTGQRRRLMDLRLTGYRLLMDLQLQLTGHRLLMDLRLQLTGRRPLMDLQLTGRRRVRDLTSGLQLQRQRARERPLAIRVMGGLSWEPDTNPFQSP